MNQQHKRLIPPEVAVAFPLPETWVDTARCGSGHINETFCLTCCAQGVKPVRFILQGLSPAAFAHPEQLMENFVRITAHLRRKIEADGGDPMRETLNLVPTCSGAPYYIGADGRVWRLLHYVENTVCFDHATPQLFEESARAFGRFQWLLRDFPAHTLHETIPEFHNTEARYEQFAAALKADAMGRAAEVQPEVQFVLARKADCSVAMDALRQGRLPLRVTHNDTKLNNVLFDRDSRKALCVIDLDTTMPGLSIWDFGDSIRFGANHCDEDEQDLAKVSFDLELYRRYTHGFLQGAQGSLTKAEREYLPWGARLMTLECGMRFLTDYLQGDRYFHTQYFKQNLYRCRTQFKLMADMEECWQQMNEIANSFD